MKRGIVPVVVVALLSVAVAVAWGATVKPSAPSRGGAAVAFARADVATKVVRCFGGKGTTDAQVTAGDTTNYMEITFTGKYPKDITPDEVIVNATSAFAGTAASASVPAANSTQIVVLVNTWLTNFEAPSPTPVSVSLFLGQIKS